MTDDTQRKFLYEEITKRFSKTAIWDQLEAIAAIKTADLPEPTNEATKEKLIAGIKSIKASILALGIKPENLTFLDDEIDRLQNTVQISLYQEKPEYVDNETLERFARLSYVKEGVIGIRKPYNIDQLRHITRYIYKQTSNIKFFISDETVMRGQIVAEVFNFIQDIPVASLCLPKKVDGMSTIFLFGDKIDSKEWTVAKEITQHFHVYTFIDESMQEYILLSSDEVELGDYEIHGMLLKVTDRKKLSESSRIPTKMPFFFLEHAVGTVVKYQDCDAYLQGRKELNITKQDLFNYPFVFEMRNRELEGDFRIPVVAKHPKWYKQFIWAWLCHRPQGIGSEWPLAPVIIGPKKSGKTLLLERLDKIGLESQPLFKGEDSTIKGVVPSFHGVPPKRGYFCDGRRFSLMDEFFRCLANLSDTEERKEALAKLNSLLEHKQCIFSTGTGKLKVQMRTRAIFMNNAPRGVKCVEDLLQQYDESFNSRTLIYWQREDGDHVKMVRNCKEKDLKLYEGKILPTDFIGFLDYFWTFHSRWEATFLDDIYEEPIPMLTELQRNHYEARHRHHLECLMDGIIKTRCFLEGTGNFIAQAEDYAVLHEIWTNIIRSWTDGEQVRTLPVKKRAAYLPEAAQWLWRKITEKSRAQENAALSRLEVEELACKGMEIREFYTAYTILRSNALVDEDEFGCIRPYYLVPGYVEENKILIPVPTREEE